MPLANGFVERMAAGRERAQHMRNRGLATGGKAKLHAVYAPVEADSWDFTRANAIARWQGARADAVEDFRFACHGDEWAGLT
jgi:hypothetical protein